MSLLALESLSVRVEIDADFGARVVSLIDRRSGRDWMAKGPRSTQVGEDAIYLADEAVGWDECFPTVAPWDAGATPHGRRLRDHGDLWGRAWTIDAQAPDSITLSRADTASRFTRRLTLADATLIADYAVENTGPAKLPFMWALHGLLAVTPADRIALAGIDAVAATYVARDGRTITVPQLRWPGPDDALGLRLDDIHPASTRFAAKLYASHVPDAAASVGGANGWLDIGWSREIGHLGLWLNYGGWPAPGDVHHLALEPTTAPADHLGEALARGTAITLAPGAVSQWRVTMTLRAPESHSLPTEQT